MRNTVVCVVHDLTLAAYRCWHAKGSRSSEGLLSDVFGLQAHVIDISGAPEFRAQEVLAVGRRTLHLAEVVAGQMPPKVGGA